MRAATGGFCEVHQVKCYGTEEDPHGEWWRSKKRDKLRGCSKCNHIRDSKEAAEKARKKAQEKKEKKKPKREETPKERKKPNGPKKN